MLHTLNRRLELWRRIQADDGAGGQTSQWILVATVRARVSQPRDREQVEAEQASARLDYYVYVAPKTDLRRGDQLRGAGQVMRVESVVEPSQPDYLRADCELIQPEVT